VAGGIRVHWEGGDRRHDAVLATVPPAALARLVTPLAPAYAGELERFRFHGVIAWVMVLDRPLTDYYVINLTDLDTPITGIIEMGNLAPPGTFGPGRSLVYLPRYTAPDSPTYQGSDDAFRRQCTEFVRRAVPAFTPDWIVDQAVFRAPSVLPIPTLGFGRAIPAFRSPIEGLYFAHNLHVYPRPLHNDAIVEVAREFDRVLADEIGRPRATAMHAAAP
jgi:protoporphyrinogen oxidase